MSTGTKHDSGKTPYALLPFRALDEVGMVLEFGANKYSANNWRSGFAYTRLVSAAMRHLVSWLNGEDKDPESGLCHLAHAACCILFLLELIKTNKGEDDRYIYD